MLLKKNIIMGLAIFLKNKNKISLILLLSLSLTAFQSYRFTNLRHVHVHGDQGRAGPTLMPALNSFRGEHIATVSVDRFDAIPLFNGKLKTSGSEIDRIITIPKAVDSGRLAFYLNAEKSAFPIRCPIVVTLKRPTLLKPIHVGIATFAQPFNLDFQNHGIYVIAGLDPTKTHDAEMHFLYIRGM
jgi:hypothetical protein